MTNAPSIGKVAMRERLRVLDERRLVDELEGVAARLSARITEKHIGTPSEKEALVSGIADMCRALQSAVADGGRKAFEEELSRWREFALHQDVLNGVDSAMTRMPAPRERQPRTG
jgi:hypothetical protein